MGREEHHAVLHVTSCLNDRLNQSTKYQVRFLWRESKLMILNEVLREEASQGGHSLKEKRII